MAGQSSTPLSVDQMHGVAVAAKDAALGRNVVAHDPVRTLGLALLLRMRRGLAGLGREAHHQLRPRFRLGDGREDVGVLHQIERGCLAGLLDLAGRRVGGAPVGDGGGEHGDVGRQATRDRFQHLLCGLDTNDADVRRIGQRDGTGNERHARAECGRCLGDGVALLAGRTVGDVAHGVDRLVRGAAGHQHVPPGERTAAAQGRHGMARSQDLLRCRDDLRHLRETPRACLVTLGHLAAIGPDEADAIGLELGDVAARRRIEPHARVHGGRRQHGLVGCEENRGGEVVGMPASHLGQKVGGRRRDDDEVGLARQADVADLVLVVEIEQIGEGLFVGQRRDRKRRDELSGRAGHHDTYDSTLVPQPPDEVEALVGGDAAADDEQDALLLHVGLAGSPIQMAQA